LATTNLEITTLSPSQNNKTTSVNDGFERIDTATQGVLDTVVTSSVTTLTNEAFKTNYLLKFSGSFVGDYTVAIFTNRDRSFGVHNGLTGNLTLDLGSGPSVVIPPHAAGEFTVCHRDSAGVTRIVAGSGGGGGSYPESSVNLSISSGALTVSGTDFTNNYQFRFTGSNAASVIDATFPSGPSKVFMVSNTTSRTINAIVGATSYYIPPLQDRIVYSNGAGINANLDVLPLDIPYVNNTSFSVPLEDFLANDVFSLLGTATGSQLVTFPANVRKIFTVRNTVTVSTGAGWSIRVGTGTPIPIGAGSTATFYSEGSGVLTPLNLLQDSSAVDSAFTLSTTLDETVLRGYEYINLTGAIAAPRVLTLPSGISKLFTVRNSASTGESWQVQVSGGSIITTIPPNSAVSFYLTGTEAEPIVPRRALSTLSSAITGATALTKTQTEANDVFISTGAPGAAYTKTLTTGNSKLIGLINNSSQTETASVVGGTSSLILPPTASVLALHTGTDLINFTEQDKFNLPITITANRVLTVSEFRAYKMFTLTGTPAAFTLDTPASTESKIFVVSNGTTVNCTVRANTNAPTAYILRANTVGTFFMNGSVLTLISVAPINNGAYISFTPTIIGSTTNPTVTYSTQTGRYRVEGDRVIGNLAIVTTAYTAGTGDFRVQLGTLPACNGTHPGNAPLEEYTNISGTSIDKTGFVLTGANQIQICTRSGNNIRVASNGVTNPVTIRTSFEYSII
jgi:hypothetical protein